MKNHFRMKTRDAAFTYRMGAGFPGDVNRTHPASIEPAMTHASTPPDAFGQGALVDTGTNTVRKLGASDASDSTAIALYGSTVRAFPSQAATATNFGAAAFGSGAPAAGVVDILRDGYIMVSVVGAPTKNGDVYVFCAVSETGHTQGGYETAAITGKTVKVSNAKFNGPADASGNAELVVWKA